MNSVKKKEVKIWAFFSIVALVCMSIYISMIEPDAYWHIKLGEWIVNNKQVLSPDQFSWIGMEQGLETFSHSWAGSVLIYLFSLIKTPTNPLIGVLIYQLVFTVIFAIVLVSIIGKRLYEQDKDSLIGFFFTILPIMISVFPTTRPQMVSNILFVVLIYTLDKWERERETKYLFALPIISLLWANIHGGTVPMIFVFMVTHIACSFLQFSCGQFKENRKPLNEIKPLAIATTISLFTAMINPYGFRIFTYSFGFNSSACKEGVGEWQPSTIMSSFGIIFMIVVVIVIVLSDKKIELNSLIDVAITAGLTLLYVRGTAYLSICLCFFLLRNMDKLPYMAKSDKVSKTSSYALCFSIIFLIVFLLYLPVRYNKAMEDNKNIISQEMIDTIKENAYKKIYNGYNIGGFLIYNDIPVFIDSRADLYPEKVLRDGKYLEALTNNSIDAFDEYNFDALIVEKDTPLFYYLEINPEYKKVMNDDNYFLYEKTTI